MGCQKNGLALAAKISQDAALPGEPGLVAQTLVFL